MLYVIKFAIAMIFADDSIKCKPPAVINARGERMPGSTNDCRYG